MHGFRSLRRRKLRFRLGRDLRIGRLQGGHPDELALPIEQRKAAGDEVRFAQPGRVKVSAKIAFRSETPLEIAYGGAVPVGGVRLVVGNVLYDGSLRAALDQLEGRLAQASV